jgi:hypothetical protein
MLIKGTLEVDEERGVIYFHTDDQYMINGYGTQTPLRIQGLPAPIVSTKQMDINFKYHAVSWEVHKIIGVHPQPDKYLYDCSCGLRRLGVIEMSEHLESVLNISYGQSAHLIRDALAHTKIGATDETEPDLPSVD